MQRRIPQHPASRASRTFLLASVFFCLGIFGCNKYCFVFVSNPGESISTNNPSCQLNTSTGNVRLHITAAPAMADIAQSEHIQHVFVTLRGVETIASAIARDDSPDWQELAPKLARQPVQLDLLAHDDDSSEPSAFDDVAVPAGEYQQIHLQIAQNQPATDDAAPEENACGSNGFNCVVTTDGEIRPLVMDGASSQLLIPSDRISGGFFRVVPDASLHVTIKFEPQSTLVFSADNPVHLVPVFSVESQSFGEPTATSNH